MEDKVSVVVPVHNGGGYIVETIASCLDQTYENLELIIVDDGSTDDTLAKVRQFSDSRLRVISQTASGGPANPRNRGISEAKGEFIAFLDADDLWMPEKLEKQTRFLGENPDCALVFTQYKRVNEFGTVSADKDFPDVPGFGNPGNILERVAKGDLICNSSVLMRKVVAMEVGPLNESPLFRGSEDFEYWLRVASKNLIGWVSEPLVKYRTHNANLSTNNRSSMNRGGFIAVKQLAEQFDDCGREKLQPAMNFWGYSWRMEEFLGDGVIDDVVRDTADCRFSWSQWVKLLIARRFPKVMRMLRRVRT